MYFFSFLQLFLRFFISVFLHVVFAFNDRNLTKADDYQLKFNFFVFFCFVFRHPLFCLFAAKIVFRARTRFGSKICFADPARFSLKFKIRLFCGQVTALFDFSFVCFPLQEKQNKGVWPKFLRAVKLFVSSGVENARFYFLVY